MTFRLRHRASFSTSAVSHALQLRIPRASAAPEWSWTWPLTSPEPPSPSTNEAPPPPWVSAVRVVSVSDDASHIAFVSRDEGRVALVSLTPRPSCVPLLLSVDNNPAIATSVCFLSLSLAESNAPTTYVCVGYATGYVAIFSTLTCEPLFITRPAPDLPIRRLRLYPALQLAPLTPVYPSPSSNAALVAIVGWGGTVVQFPLSELGPIVSRGNPPFVDLRGAGWTVWNTNVQRAVLDVAACSTDPASICDLDLPPGQAPLRIVCAGVAPALAAYSATNSPAFSARDVAKRAASSMLSVAKGFLFSRITGEQTAPNPTEEERNVVTGAARFIISWGNDTTPANASINLRDVRDSARKSVNAVLSRSRKSIDINDIAASYGLRSQNSRPLSDSVLHGDQTALAETALDQSNSENAFSSQRSRFAGEEVALAAKLPQNARVVERIAAAPLPCSLLATSDTLGRIFVQDSRDLCVLRVLKGYRDAHVAWVAQGGPLLAILAPRLNVLELHRPLDVKRIAAFRLRPGSMLVQSAMHRALCISPDGHLYELMRSRKSGGVAAGGIKEEQPNGKAEELETAHSATVNGVEDMTEAVRTGQSGSVVDYESLHMFLEAVKRGQTSVAVECLQNVRDSRQKVAHLMTAVLTCASYVRPEIHIALSSKAAQIASSLEDRDLLSRFEAHSRLAEAYAIVFAEILPEGAVAEENSVAKYGKQLMEDDIGAGLLEFAVEAMKGDASPANVSGKRTRSSKEEGNMLTCERFILSHALHPSMDIRSRSDYILRPRRDISEAEQVWLAKLYFSRLLHVDSADLPTEGREHPATKDVFLALSEVIGLQEAELAHHFAIFFLHVPLLALLKTRVAIHASPIRCAISRLRTGFSQEIVDQVLIEECETSACIPNAVLLTRLCVIHERRRSDGNDALFLASLDRLEEVLLFRKLIAGSKIPPAVYEKFTARGCSGALGDAERHAVTSLIEWHEFDRAAKILIRLDESRRGHKLAWQESASVSEAALLACRKKAVSVITDAGREVIPENVVSWILSVEVDEDQSHWIQLINEQRETVLRKLRSVLLSAHQYFSDSSVDAVRCLQLAEAMSALIELEINWHTKSKASATGPHENPESVAESGNQRPKRDSSTMGESKDFGSRQNAIIDHVNTDETQRSSPINNAEESNEVCEIVEETRMHTSEASLITTNELERDRLGKTGRQGKGDFFSGEGPSTAAEGTSHVHPFAIPTLENTGLDDDALDPVPTLSDGSDRMEDLPDTRAKVPKGSSGAEIDRRVREDTQNNDSDEDDDMFFDAASRQASDLLAADENNDAAMVPEIADN